MSVGLFEGGRFALLREVIVLRILIVALAMLVPAFNAEAESGSADMLRLEGRVDESMFHQVRHFRGNSIVVNSRGGDVVWGTRIAELLADRDMTVTVEGRCLSACFSYIFLPAARRVLRRNSQIGLHVGPEELLLVAEMQGAALPTWDFELANRIRAVFARRGISQAISREAVRRFNIRFTDLPATCRTNDDPFLGAGRMPCQHFVADVQTWYLSTAQLQLFGIAYDGAEIQYRWIGDVPLEILFAENPQPQYFGDCLFDRKQDPVWQC